MKYVIFSFELGDYICNGENKVLVFDTLGTLIGCASKAEMLDKDGKLPGIKGALLADAIGTTVGAIFGASTITTFGESA